MKTVQDFMSSIVKKNVISSDFDITLYFSGVGDLDGDGSGKGTGEGHGYYDDFDNYGDGSGSWYDCSHLYDAIITDSTGLVRHKST